MSSSERGQDKSLKRFRFRRNRKEGDSSRSIPEQDLHRLTESGDVANESRSVVNDICDGLITVLRVTKEASAAFPPLQSAVGGLLSVCDVFKKMGSNADDLKVLRGYVDRLNDMVKTLDNHSCPEGLRNRLNALSKQLNDVVGKINALGGLSTGRRLLAAEKINGDIQAHIRSLSWSMNNFIVGTAIDIELAVDKVHIAVQSGFEQVDGRFDDLAGQLEGVGQQIAAMAYENQTHHTRSPITRYVRAARYDYRSDRVLCTQGTRKETLEMIYWWLKPDDPSLIDYLPPTEHVGQTAVFWLNGLSGTGKTTLAQTTSKWCDERGLLGATVFCARSDDRNNVQLIFPTISHQFCLLYPSFAEHVAETLNLNPDLYSSLPSYQLEKLLVEPLRKMKQNADLPANVVIVDALDECVDDGAMVSVILKALALHIDDLAPLKFLITSRPVDHIIAGFQTTSLINNTRTFAFQEVPSEQAQRDITSYLETELGSVANFYSFLPPWPSHKDMMSLVDQANGLFIFAATAVKFIQSNKIKNPKGQLSSLLSSKTSSSIQQPTPYTHLNALYLQVLKSAFPEMEPELHTQLKMVLGSVVILYEQLHSSTLESLLRLQRGTVRRTLHSLQSVIVLPEREIDVIRTIHPSFPDFLTDPIRCHDPRFVVNISIQHNIVAKECLRALQTLRRNICQLDESKLNSEVPDLMERIGKYIPAHLRYASRYWALHLVHSEPDDIMLELLEAFCKQHLLHWIEVLSLLGELGIAGEALASIQRMLNELPLPLLEAQQLLVDCERIVREFFPGLSVSWSQAYRSVVPFCPTDIRFRKIYSTQVQNTTRVCGLPNAWGPCLSIIEGDTWYITSVAFSPDGRRIVSSCRNGSILLWDARTGSPLATLVEKGRKTWQTLVFSPDGKVLHFNRGNQVQLLDSTTGHCLKMLDIQSSGVECVALSPNGEFLAAGLNDGRIVIWEMPAGTEATILSDSSITPTFEQAQIVPTDNLTAAIAKHTSTMAGIGSPPLGWEERFIRGRSHYVAVNTINPGITRSYNPSRQQADIPLEQGSSPQPRSAFQLEPRPPPAIKSLVFSRSGSVLASGSYDGKCTVWRVRDWSLLRSFHNDSSAIRSVDISIDDRMIACGAKDKTVTIWDMQDETQRPFLLLKSACTAWAVAFSPQNTQLLAFASHAAVEFWNLSDSCQEHVGSLRASSDDIMALHFSANGKFLVTGGQDGSVRLLEIPDHIYSSDKFASPITIPAVTSHRRSMKGRLPGYLPSFSKINYDRSSASRMDSTDTTTAYKLATASLPAAHKNAVMCVALSPDNSTIAIASQDSTICLWDVSSGTSTKILKGHKGIVSWVAFSRNGKQIVSNGPDDHTRQWDVENGNCVGQYIPSGVNKIPAWTSCFCRKDHCIISFGNYLRLWEVSSGEEIYSFNGHIDALAISSDDRLVSFAEGDSIHVLNTDTREIAMTRGGRGGFGPRLSMEQHFMCIVQLSFSDDSTRLLSGSEGCEINLWDLTTSGNRRIPLEKFNVDEIPRHLSFSQDHKSIVSSAGYLPIPQHSQPLCATDNSAHTSGIQVYYYLKDGWIWCALPEKRRRICWVPKRYRDFVEDKYSGIKATANTIAAQGNIIVFGSQSGQVTLIDFSGNPQ